MATPTKKFKSTIMKKIIFTILVIIFSNEIKVQLEQRTYITVDECKNKIHVVFKPTRVINFSFDLDVSTQHNNCISIYRNNNCTIKFN